MNFDDTQNLYIEGDNLEVLKLLQTAYYRKVKMIYIDPPYNIGNDFVYEDDFNERLWHGIRKLPSKPQRVTLKPWEDFTQIGLI